MGVFTIALFVFLAAVYLTLETDDRYLQEGFRKHALVSAVFVGIMALVVFLLSEEGAPMIRRKLSASWWTWPLQIATGLLAVGAIFGLWTHRFLGWLGFYLQERSH